jgi:hypothetical protein
MNITPNKTYTFKLTSGEELIAKVLEVFDDHLVISQPISTIIGQQGLQMVPSLFSANITADVRLNNNSYSMVTEPREDVSDSYLQATTGIQVPPRKQIITG